MKIGDPFDPVTELGPMAFKAHFEKLLAFGVLAKEGDGYKVLTGTARTKGFDKGYFFAPTLVETSDNMTDVRQQEMFGPFAMIQRVADLD